MDPGTTGNYFSPGLPLLTHFHFISSPSPVIWQQHMIIYYRLWLLEFPANLVITGILQEHTVITMRDETSPVAQTALTQPCSGSLCEEDGVWHKTSPKNFFKVLQSQTGTRYLQPIPASSGHWAKGKVSDKLFLPRKARKAQEMGKPYGSYFRTFGIWTI